MTHFEEEKIPDGYILFGGHLNIDGTRTQGRLLAPGKPCSHRGCLAHFTHRCESCGRIGGVPRTDYEAHKFLPEFYPPTVLQYFNWLATTSENLDLAPWLDSDFTATPTIARAKKYKDMPYVFYVDNGMKCKWISQGDMGHRFADVPNDATTINHHLIQEHTEELKIALGELWRQHPFFENKTNEKKTKHTEI